jgi:hypothetical protein
VSRHLDKLIENYNQRVRSLNENELLTIKRAYSESEEEKKENNEGEKAKALILDVIDELSKKTKEINDKMREINDKMSAVANKVADQMKKIENAYRNALRIRYMSRNRIVSPKTYRKIMLYYRSHKRQKYYSRYKIDNELHNFIMKLGRYLESLDKEVRRKEVRDFSFDYRYYALLSVSVFASVNIEGTLGFLSSVLVEASHVVELVLHVVLEVFPKILKSIPLLSSIMPNLLAATVIALSAGALLVIIGYAIHPERDLLFKRLADKVKINLGIRKSRIYAAYIMYVYKLYDILSAMSSYIIKIGKLVASGKDIDIEKMAKNLEDKAKKSAQVVNLKDEIVAYIKDKLGLNIFKETESKIKTLDETISVNLENIKKLTDSVKEGNKKLDVFNYKFAVSTDAMKKLGSYYGDKFQGKGEWVEVTVQYKGNAKHKSANPLQKVDISGFSGNLEEASNFIGAVLAISDKLIIDRIGDQELEIPLMTIDLQKLKLLSYESKPLIDTLAAPMKELTNWVKKLIKGKTDKEDKLDPADLANLMFEAYININDIKLITEEGNKTQNEEKGEEVNKTEGKQNKYRNRGRSI